MVLKVTAAPLQSTQSIDLRICVPTVFGINLYPPLRNATTPFCATWPQAELAPLNSLNQPKCPRLNDLHLRLPYHARWVRPNKSLDSYSLRVNGAVGQRVVANGRNRR